MNKDINPSFVETVKVENGIIKNLDYHLERLNYTRKNIFGTDNIIICKDIDFPEIISGDLFKLRIVYAENILFSEMIPYSVPEINNLKIVVDNDISYTYKSTDRSAIDRLKIKGYDDILIIKDGLVTDSSFCNVAFYTGEEWITPSTPLLKGTMRKSLIQKNIITEKKISINDIKKFSRICLFNALNDFGTITVPVSEIYF